MQTCRSRRDAADDMNRAHKVSVVDRKAFTSGLSAPKRRQNTQRSQARPQSPNCVFPKPPSHTPTGFRLASSLGRPVVPKRPAFRVTVVGGWFLGTASFQWSQIDHHCALVWHGSSQTFRLFGKRILKARGLWLAIEARVRARDCRR